MAKRTINALAKVIARRVDRSTDDTTFIEFVESMLNVTLQEIFSAVTYAHWLKDQDTLTTVAAQQYISVASDMDIDSIINIINTTDNTNLEKTTLEEVNQVDPGRDRTGYPTKWWLETVAGVSRIYFYPRPDAVYSLTASFGNIYDDVASGSSSVLPAKYEGVLMDLTIPKVYERIEPTYDTSQILARGMGGFNAAGEPTGLARIIWDAKNERSHGQMANHRPWEDEGIERPSFPSNFQI